MSGDPAAIVSRTRRSRLRAPVCGRRRHHSALSRGGAHPAAGHYPHSRAARRRNSALRCPASRYPPPARRHPAVCQRARAERVPGRRRQHQHPRTTAGADSSMTIQATLKSQYHASLAMLLEAIEHCPPSLWTSPVYANRYWQVAYHVLYYTDLYLQPDEASFTPWELHRPEHHRFGPRPDLTPYTQAELLAYGHRCDALVDSAVDRLDLTAAGSGFSWYQMPKLEHQLVNLRHLQHHTGQLADRLRQAAGRGVRWVGGNSWCIRRASGPPPRRSSAWPRWHSWPARSVRRPRRHRRIRFRSTTRSRWPPRPSARPGRSTYIRHRATPHRIRRGFQRSTCPMAGSTRTSRTWCARSTR